MKSVPKAFLYCSPPVLNSHLKRNQSNKTKSNQWIEDVSFYRNCGAASVGGYNRVIWYYQLIWKRKLTTVKSFKADVSSSDEGKRSKPLLWSSSRWPMYVFKSVDNIKLAKNNQFYIIYKASFWLIAGITCGFCFTALGWKLHFLSAQKLNLACSVKMSWYSVKFYKKIYSILCVPIHAARSRRTKKYKMRVHPALVVCAKNETWNLSASLLANLTVAFRHT